MFKPWNGLVLVLCLFMMVNWSITSKANNLYVPILEIVGDIHNPLLLKSLEDFTLHRITLREKTLAAISLQDMIEKVQTKDDKNTIFYAAPDLVAQVDANLLANSYLSFSTT